MFPKLPLEVILSIVCHLELEDKINLKLTCIALNHLITDNVLYETLNFLKKEPLICNAVHTYSDLPPHAPAISKNYLKTFFGKFQSGELDSSVVRVLQIDLETLKSHQLSLLYCSFTNISRVITTKETKSNDPYGISSLLYDIHRCEPGYQMLHSDDQNPLLKWRETIEKIDSRYDWAELVKDLMFNKYPLLTELDVVGASFVLDNWRRSDKVSFFSNAPLLTTLTLRGARISFKILETIHAGFPLLKSLRLFGSRFKAKSGSGPPATIVPANAMTYFGLFRSSGFNTKDIVLDYILNKYPNLQQLTFSVNYDRDYCAGASGPIPRHPTHQLISRYMMTPQAYTALVSAGLVTPKPIPKPIESFPNSNSFESKFFSNLPRSLKILTINTNSIDNAVAALADSNSNITMLDLIDQSETNSKTGQGFYEAPDRVRTDPSMIEHYKKLASLRILKITFNSTIQTSTPEFISSSVTKLFIGLYGDPFHIDWILSMFPVLEELYINPPECDLIKSPISEIRGQNNDAREDAEEIRPNKVYSKLRILSIRSNPICPGLFDYMKTATPHLEELYFNICFSLRPSSTKTIPYKYDLSNWNLKKCEISYDYVGMMGDIFCLVTIQGLSKDFAVETLYRSLMPAGYRSFGNRMKLNVDIKFDAVEKLKFFGFSVLKVGEKIIVGL